MHLCRRKVCPIYARYIAPKRQPLIYQPTHFKENLFFLSFLFLICSACIAYCWTFFMLFLFINVVIIIILKYFYAFLTLKTIPVTLKTFLFFYERKIVKQFANGNLSISDDCGNNICKGHNCLQLDSFYLALVSLNWSGLRLNEHSIEGRIYSTYLLNLHLRVLSTDHPFDIIQN